MHNEGTETRLALRNPKCSLFLWSGTEDNSMDPQPEKRAGVGESTHFG
jgi:hypothetical protein